MAAEEGTAEISVEKKSFGGGESQEAEAKRQERRVGQ